MATPPVSGMMLAAALTLGVSAGLPEHLTGPKIGLGVAGLVGGIIALALTSYPKIFMRVCVILAGGAAGYYLAPLVVSYFSLSRDSSLGAAMILGLIAFPLFAGAHALAQIWKADPLLFIRLIRGRRDDRE